MKSQLFKIIFVAGVAAAFVAINPSSAQNMSNADIMNLTKEATKNFSVEFSPENPGANTKVSAQLISYTFDANRAETAWIINGKIAGTGKTFSFTTGNLGSVISLGVSIITDDEVALSKNFSFRAVEADLLWETPGYAPPPYQGKILAVSQSIIKITAVPQGFTSSDSRLIYEWKRNDKAVSDASGSGKKTFTFYAAPAGTENIEVRISNPNNTAIAVKQIQIPINEPKILFYEENPLEGPQYQKEISPVFSMAKPELILRAEPFFFSKRAIPLLSYEWKMNGKNAVNQAKPNVINFSAPENAKGNSIIELLAENPKNILERALKTLKIQFNFQ